MTLLAIYYSSEALLCRPGVEADRGGGTELDRTPKDIPSPNLLKLPNDRPFLFRDVAAVPREDTESG